MKKIVIINYNIYAYMYRPDLKISGGAELQIAILAKLLSQKNYQVIFFTGDFGQNEILEIDGYTFIKQGVIGQGPLKKIIRFVKYIRSAKPDVVLERGTSPFTFLAAILGKLFGIPFIFCGASDVNFAKKEKDPSFCGSRVKQRIYHWTLPFIRHFVVQKNGQATLLKKNFGIVANVTVIGNFSPENKSLSTNSPKQPNIFEYDAAWIANLIPYKQPELFIELARCNPSFKFLLIGASADKGYNDKIMASARTVGNLTAVGYIKHDQVIKWMQKSKIIVNTTKIASGFEEGFSNVQIMGWMCGLPSLSLISDPDNVIVANQMGFRSGTFNQLCTDFKKLTEDTDLYSRMSRNAIDYVIKNHNNELLLQKYLQVFSYN